MRTPPLHDEREWPYVLTLLPLDLEDSARESEALVRCRNVPDAVALMRMALAYAVSDLSLKDVAAWANALGLAQITGPGLFYRLREAEAWLQRVLAQTLQSQVETAAESRLRLRVVDATVIHGPGATGTEWRAHVLIDPGTGGFRAVELTDAHGGEGYGRYRVAAQDVILGDQAYTTARGLWAVQSAQACVVARMNPHTIRVCDEKRQRISLRSREKRVPKTGGNRVQDSRSYSPSEAHEEPQVALGAGHRLGFRTGRGRPNPFGRGHLAFDDIARGPSFATRIDAALSAAVADRVVV